MSLSLRKTDLTILSLIETRTMYGYEILRQHRDLGTQSQIYYSLSKLRRLGYVRMKCQPGTKVPDRKTYAITLKGSQALHLGVDQAIHEHGRSLQKAWEQYRSQAEMHAQLMAFTHLIASGSLSRTRS